MPRFLSSDQVRRLPRLAAVAFAARCARRAQPVFRREWPHASIHAISWISGALSLAEAFAARTHVVGESTGYDAAAPFSDAAARAVAAAHAAMHSGRAALVAMAAADAAAAARAAVEYSSAARLYAYDAAVHAAAACNRSEIEFILTDFQVVDHGAKSFGWNDESPVGPELFPPLLRRPSSASARWLC